MSVACLVCGTPRPCTLFQKFDTKFLDQKYKIYNNANTTVTIYKMMPVHQLKLHKNIVKILVQGNIAWRSSNIW